MRWPTLSLTVVLTIGVVTTAQSPPEKPITPKDRKHWAFQPIQRPTVPNLPNEVRILNPVDSFINARLIQKHIPQGNTADRLTLLRRISLTLTGITPTLQEQDAFLADQSPKFLENLVDRLLDSPHFGERQAQHWLDVVRFAESNGYEVDGDRPHAWRYRDYVINSFNTNKPFDTFLIEQIAGDELAKGKEPETVTEPLIATGFHRAGPVHVVSGNIDPEVARQEVLTEIVQGVGSAFMGLTVHCARCHDHKFDPISQADYYRMEAFFAGTRFRDTDISTKAEKAAYQKAVIEHTLKITPLKGKVSAIDEPYRKKIREQKLAALEPALKAAYSTPDKNRTPEQKQLAKDAETLLKITWDEVVNALSPADREKRAAIRQEIHALEAKLPAAPGILWAVNEDESIPATHILKRGEVKRKGDVVQPAFVRVIDQPREQPASRPTKLDFAKWLASTNNPLTARVIVNRIWSWTFGQGLVKTPNDFGLHGEPPTHPELLDWLASELIANGWKLKPIYRLIVLSATFQQSSQIRSHPNAEQHDPMNHWYWKFPRRRLEGETIRDMTLHASGELNPTVGGPSVLTPLEPEVYDLIFTEGEPDGLWKVNPDARQHHRRSIYLFSKRNVRLPLLEAFDQPDRLTPCAMRPRSTFAPQALILMNGPIMREQSLKLAIRIMRESPKDVVNRLYRLALGRPATETELRIARAFLDGQTSILTERLLARLPVTEQHLPSDLAANELLALTDFCLALLNSNEFVYLH